MSEAFEIQMDTERVIRGEWFSTSADAQAVVVICHGYKGFKDWGMFPYTAKKLAASKMVDVITFNFSHNGVGENLQDFNELEKFAHNTYSRELEDLHAVLEQIDADKPVYLLGHSRGGGVALIYAMDHPQRISGVISWNGITDVDLFSAEEKQQMRENGRAYIENARTGQQMPLDVEILEDMETNKERFDIVGRIAACPVPVICIQGTEDFAKLVYGTERLRKQAPHIPWVRIEGGNHTFNARHPFAGTTTALEEAIEQSLSFIGEQEQRASRS